MRDLTDLVRVATRQRGLLTTSQLRAGGVSKRQQEGHVRAGVLIPVRRDVLRLAGAEPTWEQRMQAVILTPGTPVVASHRAALRIWALRTRFEGLEVAIRAPRSRRLPGVTVHRSVDLIKSDVTRVDGLLVTTVARTLVDAGLIFPETEVQRLVDHSVATGLVKPGELLDIRRRIGEHGRNGVVKLGNSVSRLPPGAEDTDSGSEVSLLRVILDGGLPPPVEQFPVTVNGESYRLDLSYPDVMLALEYDGFDYHTRVERFVEDRRRQNDLIDAGWTVRRYTHEELRDRPGEVVRGIRCHLTDL